MDVGEAIGQQWPERLMIMMMIMMQALPKGYENSVRPIVSVRQTDCMHLMYARAM